jgi:2-polyprenyl-6-methoxyphenol hydroxylase-like FAD-dependent oxidoreductase
MPEVLIIGAGPAGSVAAILLGRAGWDVRIVEQHRFPRDKVCGECLSALGIQVAARLGIADSLRNLGAVELTRTILIAPDAQEAQIQLPAPMWGLSRSAMDQCLLDFARQAGASILQPARCEKLIPGDTPIAHIRDLQDNSVQPLAISRVLLCDGKGSSSQTLDLGIKAHFIDVNAPRDAIVLFGLSGHYIGIAPIEANRWNVAMSIPAWRISKSRGNFDALFAQLLDENIALKGSFSRAHRAGRWLASPLPRFAVQSEWPAGIIPLGNAAAALEPIGGEGIGLAMRSAELAATELIDAHRENRPVDVARLRQRFKNLWRVRRAGCRAAALAVSHPGLARFAAPIVDQTPALHRVALQLTGKLA